MTPVQGPDREERLNHMVLTYEKDLLRLCCVYLRDITLAQDAVQETFIKAYRRMDRFEGRSSEKTWLMRIAVNTCKDMKRGIWLRHVDASASLDDLPLPVDPPSVEHIALTSAIMALPRKYMEVILLHCDQGLTVRETAAALGITPPAVINRLKKGAHRTPVRAGRRRGRMKNIDISDQAIHAALNKCLSGAEALPSRRGEILRAAKGEDKVKRKMNLGLVLALILVLLTTSVAVAEALGLFGQIGQQEHADARLPGLDIVSTVMDKDFYIGTDVTLTVNQAYYDGSRIFISYTLEGDYQGVGVDIHDGMQIGDTYIDIIGGDAYDTEDGQRIGWKECEVPAELAEDEVTFSIGSFIVGKMKESTIWHSFTVKKSAADMQLTGSAKTTDWSATATLTASAIDVKGEIAVECPKAWTDIWSTWENPGKLDYIHEWRLYVNGVKTEGHNLDGGIRVVEDGKLSCGICYKLDAVSADMKLVPVYVKSGEKMDEAIVLILVK